MIAKGRYHGNKVWSPYFKYLHLKKKKTVICLLIKEILSITGNESAAILCWRWHLDQDAF